MANLGFYWKQNAGEYQGRIYGLAARGGYAPRPAVTLWEKMGKVAGGNQPPKWLSTHPPHQDRINDLRAYSEKVMPLYAQAKGSVAAAGK